MGTATFAEAAAPVPPFLRRRLSKIPSSIKAVPGVISGSASYATGGDTLGAAQVDALSDLHEVIFANGGFNADGSKYAVWLANLLLIFDLFATEEANATDVSGDDFKVVLVGQG